MWGSYLLDISMLEKSAIATRPESAKLFSSDRRSQVLSAAAPIAVILPAAMAYLILYRQAFSFPYRDDYHAIVDFAISYKQSPNWISKAVAVIGHQHNEYKLIFEHLIVALQLRLIGRLNFSFLVAMGNLFLLPIAFLLWRIHLSEERPSNWRLLEFAPISLLFFSLTYWETLDWAMAGLVNVPVVFFALLSIKLLFSASPPGSMPSRFLWSCVSAVAAALSSASGFLLAPVGLLILMRRRALAASAVWCGGFLIALPMYLYHYVHLDRGSPTNLARALFFFAFLGCALPKAWAAASLGVFLVAIFGWSIRSRFEKTHPVSFYSAVWVFLCAGLASWVRASAFSRYSIFSILLLIFAYKFVCLTQLGSLRWPAVWIVHIPSFLLSLVLCVSSDLMANKYLGERKQMVLIGMQQYLSNPEANSPIDPRLKQFTQGEDAYERVMLTAAIRNNLYPQPIL